MSSEVGKPLFWIITALVLCIWSIVANDVTLGLDLQGGTTLRYELDPPDTETTEFDDVDSMIDTTVETLRARIDTYGIKESSTTRQGEREVLIELPGSGSAEADSIKALVSPVGRLEWRIAAYDDALHGITVEDERTRLTELLAKHTGKAPEELDLTGLDRSFDDVLYRWYAYSDKVLGERAPGRLDAEGELDFSAFPLTSDDFLLLRIERGPRAVAFTGADVGAVRQAQDSKGAPAVGIDIRKERAEEFADWSEENIGNAMAIVLDHRLAQPPANIKSRLQGGFVIESGSPTGFKTDEIKNYLTIIRSGSLQMKPRLLYTNSIGPSLGESSIQAGVQASLWAAIITVVCMLAYYRFNGLIAVLCLTVNMTLLLGLLMFLNATITLPGMAGLVLTLGMAVDANILVFERLREEKDREKGLAQSVKLGFERAVSSILDANITTFLTAFILYKLGTGPVRGFAVVLMLGILTSVFSVLVFGKTLYMWLIEKNRLPNMAMGRLIQKETSIGFMAKSKLFSKVSIAAVIGSLVLFGMFGNDTFGLDFVGGYKAQVRLEQPATQGEVSQALAGAFPGAQVVSVLDEESGEGRSRQFVVKIKADATDEAAAATGEDTLSRYETALKQALSGMLRPDFAAGLEVVEDAEANLTRLSATLNFEGPIEASAVAARLGFVGDLQADPAGPDAVRIAGTLPGVGREPQQVVQSLVNALDDVPGLPAISEPLNESTTIGSRVGSELRDSAIRAILLSFIVIVLYIRVRFKEYRYGIAAIIALFHDVSITLGLVALAHAMGMVDIEIDLPMIAAFLTIVGYSLNDTIVVFDRIRENQPRLDRPIEEVIDISINQTLSRTLLTSVTTLLALIVIFWFSLGQQHVLEGFSFAMIIGVLVGTYSSIFVASPLVSMLARRAEEQTA